MFLKAGQRVGMLCVLAGVGLVFAFAAKGLAFTQPDEELLKTAYGKEETLHYSITWLGIKAGELVLRLTRLPDEKEQESFLVLVTAKSAGLLAFFYPVEDRFEMVVQGRNRLPRSLLMDQKEGSRKNKKQTFYDQKNFLVTYRKNTEPPVQYTVDGPVHNEFSSFLSLRTLPLQDDEPLIVPTFADKKRHEVPVFFEGRERVGTIFGKVSTIKLRPHLTFKGLYEKMGDPLIWFTDDSFRIPVRIKAQIVIGSLTARLVEYQGPGEHLRQD